MVTPAAAPPVATSTPDTPTEGEVLVRAEILKRIDDSLKIEKDFQLAGAGFRNSVGH